MYHNCALSKKYISESSIQSYMISTMHESATSMCGGELTSALKEITRSNDKSENGPLSSDRLHKAVSGQTSYSVNFRGIDVIASAVNEDESSGKGECLLFLSSVFFS